ncbi:MAG: hypothetical protein BWY84_00012 [Candidatus Aerophobetes bacterium ADurb.Bin490]|nr:MAG: hypothetical protein BWY84_00012 [Candidatus Aerophobetes bacterium ADurb.Bin490]
MKYKLIKLAFKVTDMANKASSDYLMSLCHSAYFHYVDDLVLVYAIVKADTDTSMLADFPVVDFDFDNVIKYEEEPNYQISILNKTVKPKTVEELYGLE